MYKKLLQFLNSAMYRDRNVCYLADLGCLCVAGSLDLVWTPLGEANAEQAQHVVVSCLDINMGFNECLPLPDQGSEFIGGKRHTLTIERTS